MLPIEVERRLRFVAVFLAAYTASHKPACITYVACRTEPQWQVENKSRDTCSAPTSGNMMIFPEAGRCTGRVCGQSLSSHKADCASTLSRPSGPDGQALVVQRGKAHPKSIDDFAARSCGLRPGSNSFFGQRGRTVPTSREWKRTCSSWPSYATTPPTAFGWRRQLAVHEHKSLFIEMAERWLTLAERAEKARG